MPLLIVLILLFFSQKSFSNDLPQGALNNNPFFNGNNLGNSNANPPPFLDIINNLPINPLGPLENLNTVALGIYTNGEINNTLLNGRFGFAEGNSNLSLKNRNDVLNDIVKGGNEVDAQTNSQILKVNGVAYSSTGTISLSISPINVGSIDFLPNNSISVKFINISGSGEIDIAFNGNFTGLLSSTLKGGANEISNIGNITTSLSKKANFNLKGDVIEASVSTQDDVGTYEGGINITLTSL